MKRIRSKKNSILVLACAGALLAAGPAFAEKPDWAGGGGGGGGGGKHGRPEAQEKHGGKREVQEPRGRQAVREEHGPRGGKGGSTTVSVRFEEHQRTVVREYFSREFRSGSCPPGLAKKGNGCMPPGQAKKWAVGRPLPRDVIYYDLPPAILIELGPPPPLHRFVRVAGDILMIAVGTGMVVDAIEDLSSM